MPEALVLDLAAVRMTDIGRVGGKNASLGEMISQLAGAGVRVPGGFATTAAAYREFLAHDRLDQRIAKRLEALKADDVKALGAAGQDIRSWIVDQPFPARLQEEIGAAYSKLTAESGDGVTFAVRSSATAEDLPDASFAGQQETFLNVHGRENLLDAIKHVYASLYNDRAISYRVHKGFAHADVALSWPRRSVRDEFGIVRGDTNSVGRACHTGALWRRGPRVLDRSPSNAPSGVKVAVDAW